jgi:hypothetical protein
LLHDGSSTHDFPSTDKVEVLLLPPNTTSVFQPLDLGIINSTKSRFRANLAMFLVAADHQYLREKADRLKVPASSRGLLHGKEMPNVADASIRMAQEWKRVDPSCFLRCWAKSTIIPRERLGLEARTVVLPPDDEPDPEALADVDTAAALAEYDLTVQSVDNEEDKRRYREFAAEEQFLPDSDTDSDSDVDARQDEEGSQPVSDSIDAEECLTMLMRLEASAELKKTFSGDDWNSVYQLKTALTRSISIRRGRPRRQTNIEAHFSSAARHDKDDSPPS